MTSPQQPTIGCIVLYRLSEADAKSTNIRRDDFRAFCRANPRPDEAGAAGATGHIGHFGNQCEAGQVYPAIVVRTFGGAVNLQVLLDGNDTYWAPSRCEGDEPGQWSWPTRV